LWFGAERASSKSSSSVSRATGSGPYTLCVRRVRIASSTSTRAKLANRLRRHAVWNRPRDRRLDRHRRGDGASPEDARVRRGRRGAKDEDAERPEGQGVRTVRIDVTDSDQIAAARDELADITLAGLVNYAGIAVAAPREFLPVDRLLQQLEINLIGQAAPAAHPERARPHAARGERERQ